MPGLGLGLAGVVDSVGGGGAAAAIVDFLWEIPVNGDLTPLASGTVTDNHDTWDLSGTDYMPETEADMGSEGFWEVSGSDIQPTAV